MKHVEFITRITEAIATILTVCFEMFAKNKQDETTSQETQTDVNLDEIITNNKVIGGYYPNWMKGGIKLTDVAKYYNLIYIFHAIPDGKGGVIFDIPYEGFFNDVQLCRTRGCKILLTLGGANAGFNIQTRQESTLLLESLKRLITYIRGVDGVDLNNFEGSIVPDENEMVYIARSLKTTYGSKFMITCPPAPWRDSDLYLCKKLLDNNVLDYAAPQWYDGPGLTLESNILYQLNRWVSMFGEKNIVIGLGVGEGQNYMNIQQAKNITEKIIVLYPEIKGVFQWHAINDAITSYQFANAMKLLFNK